MKVVEIGKRVAVVGMVVSGLLAAVKIVVGVVGQSTAVLADGLESAGDVAASGVVLFGFLVAARPADEDHPYGHGRYETLTGLAVGLILVLGGIGICIHSLQGVAVVHEPPAAYGVWPLLGSIAAKAGLAVLKFHYGRGIGSSALIADAWNDTVDMLAGVAALTALGLTLHDPQRFLAADHYGGAAVGLIVIFTGLRVAKDTATQLTDVMPAPELISEIRTCAQAVPGVIGIEKCYARNTGLQYHVDLHVEVDPELTVRDSHEIATRVRFHLRERLPWIADVLVHVEPAPSVPPPSGRVTAQK